MGSLVSREVLARFPSDILRTWSINLQALVIRSGRGVTIIVDLVVGRMKDLLNCIHYYLVALYTTLTRLKWS